MGEGKSTPNISAISGPRMQLFVSVLITNMKQNSVSIWSEVSETEKTPRKETEITHGDDSQ